jgi:Saxitoxin biosynthesis operon protein SxtJ
MIREELRRLPTGPKHLRKFGLTVGGVFLLLGVWCAWRHRAAGSYLLATGGLLVVAGVAAPRALRWVYVAWMALGLTLGFGVSTVLLTLFFYLVVTPIGLVARVCGQDFLRRKRDPVAPSYWLPRESSRAPSRRDLEQQF